MNELSKRVLSIMESSPLGKMSVYVLSKQSLDAGIDLEGMSQDDIPRISSKLKDVLPFFIGDEAQNVVKKIGKLKENGSG